MSKFRKIIYALLLGCFAMWVIAFAWFHVSYSSNFPKMPDEKTGRIYRMVVNHGFVVYGSEREVRVLRNVENSQPIAIVCFLVVFTVGLLSGDFKIAPGRKLNE
jgi:predicted MPP superfamily phosphohydrolase